MFVSKKKYDTLLNRHIELVKEHEALVQQHNAVMETIERHLELIKIRAGGSKMTITEFWHEKNRITNEFKRLLNLKKRSERE